MATLVKSFAISGIEAYTVDIEVKTIEGQPMTSIIGLGDKAVQEAADRITSAIDELGFVFPKKKVIISLAPSYQKKSGSHFDLAMAIGLMMNEEYLVSKVNMRDLGMIGELALDGHLRSCRGILPMIIAAQKDGCRRVIVPAQNVHEAQLVKGIEVMGFIHIQDVIRYLEGKPVNNTFTQEQYDEAQLDEDLDFSDVRGQDGVVDGVVLAAAGGHNVLMIGAPGCGKTMIAQRIPTILPDLSVEECLELTKIYSISGLLPNGHGLMNRRPFRAPHHNASLNALIGGGANAMPGEVSLAHNGILFLDELAEFSKRTLDALRQPIEDKKVSISRVNGTHTFPANFMFVTAMNPCPCGYFSSPKCRCTDYEILKYRGRISGPIMDRIDIQKSVHPVDFFEISGKSRMRTSAELRELVTRARTIQQERYKDEPGVNCNAQMNTGLIQKYCQLDEASMNLLKTTSQKYGYSARVIHKLLRLARTSADLDGVEAIRYKDVERVLQCRDLDVSNSEMLVVEKE